MDRHTKLLFWSVSSNFERLGHYQERGAVTLFDKIYLDACWHILTLEFKLTESDVRYKTVKRS